MIRMKSNHTGSPDGVAVKSYEAGKSYSLDATPGERDLAGVFVKNGWAELVPQQGPAPAPAAGGPPAIPATWRELGAAKMVALARSLGAGDDVTTKAAAATFIDAKVAERAAAS